MTLISAVSLDGPQGWREPNAPDRKGVGRVCEYEARCQGKTGEYGKTYPQTQHGWIEFCTKVFSELVGGGMAVVAYDPNQRVDGSPSSGMFWLLECFPTHTWRSSQLATLPGKSRVGQNDALVAAYARSLQQRYVLPDLQPWTGTDTHDDLQAIVAALPAVGFLNGPCLAKPLGKAGWQVTSNGDVPAHWVEGLIWDATLPKAELERSIERPAELPVPRQSADTENPLLVDDRDDDAETLLNRGVRLFQHLADLANRGDAVGIGYAQLVSCVHGVDNFQDVTNRKYAQSDTPHVLRFAQQITEESGGAVRLTRGNVTIAAEMDAFVWRKESPHDRPACAFEGTSYTSQEWREVFPDGERRLLDARECEAVLSVTTS
jgi:hypothetical protein